MKNILINNGKVLRYIFSGIVSSFSNFIILYLLVQEFHLWYLISAMISFCFGIIVSYCLHKFITFKNYSKKGITQQFSHFFIFNLIMLGLNTLLMYIFVDVFGLWYLFSQVFITICTAFVNYFVFSRVLFNRVD